MLNDARYRIRGEIERLERAIVVAWLRALAAQRPTPSILAFFGDPLAREGQLLCGKLADAIAAGDHLKDMADAQ